MTLFRRTELQQKASEQVTKYEKEVESHRRSGIPETTESHLLLAIYYRLCAIDEALSGDI